jgi:transposase
MSKKGQKYRKHSLEFKRSIVRQQLVNGTSQRQICRTYSLSSEIVRKWTRRFLAGERLTMPRGRPKVQHTQKRKALSSEESLKAENERLRMELAFKDELIKVLEEHTSVKKKNGSTSSGD